MLGHTGVDGPRPVGHSVVLGHFGEQLWGVAGSPDQGQVHCAAGTGILQAPCLDSQVHCVLGHPAVRGPFPTWQQGSSWHTHHS